MFSLYYPTLRLLFIITGLIIFAYTQLGPRHVLYWHNLAYAGSGLVRTPLLVAHALFPVFVFVCVNFANSRRFFLFSQIFQMRIYSVRSVCFNGPLKGRAKFNRCVKNVHVSFVVFRRYRRFWRLLPGENLERYSFFSFDIIQIRFRYLESFKIIFDVSNK